MAVSKKVRFEIFKRDDFTCQYCGKQPPDVVLEVDHIDPRSAGGSDDELNLTTSCFDCNRGKSDRKLGIIKPRPDANLRNLAAQQEIAEAKIYLKAQTELTELREGIRHALIRVWVEEISTEYVPTEGQWSGWLSRYSPEEIEFALRRSGHKLRKGSWVDPDRSWGFQQVIKYTSAIMRNVRQEADAKEAVQ